MFDLEDFTLPDMFRCAAAIRGIGASSATPDEAAERIVSYFFEELRLPAKGSPACPLIRLFQTISWETLPEEAKVRLRKDLDREPPPGMKVLSLRATRGVRAEWNDASLSRAHRFIPLVPARQTFTSLPMVSALLAQFGLSPSFAFGAPFLVHTEDAFCNVFHVEEARGSRFVPAQAEFVEPYGVRSVLGFGGVLPGPEVFAAILFSSAPIPRTTADRFREIAPSAGLALVPRIDTIELLKHRLVATENLLEHHDRIVQAHSGDLEEAVEHLERSEAHARARARGIERWAEGLERNLASERDARGLAEEAGRRSEEALEARDEFISVACHELRSPAASVVLVAQTLLRKKRAVPEALVPSLERLERQAKRLANLVDTLLDVSRIRAGNLQMSLRPERIELGELVRRAIDDLAEVIRTQGTIVAIHGDEPLEGNWDPQRIEQVIVNLLSNALKYGGGRPVDVYLDHADGDARLRVQDRGAGISSEFLPHIFQRFERAGAACGSHGLGLGLYITQGIVHAQGGVIWVESHVGKGSTFTVRLPRLLPRQLVA